MGVRLTDDFALEELLGRGGMGSVRAALQRSTGRRVAIKLLPQDALDAERIGRFEREAAALSRLSHPNIVHIYTHGRDADGRPFLAMELVAGRTLQALLATEAPLEVGRAVTLAAQIAEGLAYAHEHQIAHRDVKPSNVMVARVLDRELVKLVDFGLAKLLDDGDEAGTQSGRLLGSAPYMSPEQWNQKRDIDGRADLYSFGCVFYELLTGRAPFEASGLVGYLKAHLAGAYPDPALLRPALTAHPEVLAIVARTLATDRDD
ncbi:MAG: serine/threonine protein kinase, partial [Deltaproteobacteria bacterium HGW-Deltaproteobacteria-14]